MENWAGVEETARTPSDDNKIRRHPLLGLALIVMVTTVSLHVPALSLGIFVGALAVLHMVGMIARRRAIRRALGGGIPGGGIIRAPIDLISGIARVAISGAVAAIFALLITISLTGSIPAGLHLLQPDSWGQGGATWYGTLDGMEKIGLIGGACLLTTWSPLLSNARAGWRITTAVPLIVRVLVGIAALAIAAAAAYSAHILPGMGG